MPPGPLSTERSPVILTLFSTRWDIIVVVIVVAGPFSLASSVTDRFLFFY
jgi:hypothetical protein